MASPATKSPTKSRIVEMDGVFRPMVWLAAPVFVETVLSTMVGYVDTYLTGHYIPGEDPMAAIGLMAYLLWLLANLFSAVSIGVTAVVARMIGGGKPQRAAWAMNQALMLGAILTVAAVLLAWFLGPWFVGVMNLRGIAAEYAIEYLRVVTFVLPCMMVERVGIAALRAAGDTMSGFIAMALLNIVNVIVGIALVAGIGPLPQMGIQGLALGTAAGHVVGASVVISLLLAGRAGLKLNFAWMVPNGRLISKLMRIGIPGAIDVLTINGCHLWFLGIVNGLGTLAAAAHSLTIRAESIAYLPGGAFAIAASTMTGQYLGANDRKRARQSAWMNLAVGATVMSAVGFTFFFIGDEIVSFFAGQGNHPTASLAGPLLRVAAFALPGLAATMILGGALRGAGDTRWPFLYTLLGMIGVRIPLTIYLACDEFTLPGGFTVYGLGWGVIGAWYAMIGDIYLRAMLFATRVVRERWMDTRV